MYRLFALAVVLAAVSAATATDFVESNDFLGAMQHQRALLQTTTAAAPGPALTPSTTNTTTTVTTNSTLPTSGTVQQARASTGSWLVALLIEGGNSTFYNMVSFIPNGGLVSTSQLDYASTTNIQQSTGHGYWIQNGTSIQYKVTKFILDSVGTLVGLKEEFTAGTVDPQAEFMSATNSIVTYDLAGNAVRSQRGNVTAQRIGLASVFATTGAAASTAG